MFRSLWARLLLSFMLVLGVVVGVMSFAATRTTTTEFNGYMQQRAQLDYGRMQTVLRDYYAGNKQSWTGVQPVVQNLAQATGDHIVLVDKSGVVLADSEGKLVGQQFNRPFGSEPGSGPGHGPRSGDVPIIFEGVSVGSVHADPGSPAAAFDAAFLTSVTRSLLWSAAAAAVVALVLALFLSRRILRPVAALTSAARAMEQGDLSQRVQVKSRDEVGELGSAFNAMAGSLARTEDLRRNMVTDVAHELRTPLTNIRGYLEAMRDGVLAADKVTLDSACEEAVHLSRLVDDLQELAMAEAGQLKLDRGPADLGEVVDRAVRAVTPRAMDKSIELSTHVQGQLPQVEIDQVRIAQVLLNLLSNALAHTPNGGTITVSAVGDQPSAISGQPPAASHQSSLISHHFVRVSVSDTGKGIPPDHLPYVFDRFYRVDPSRARSTGGSGIGLAISRQLIQAHGGEIWAESEVGKGSTFIFTLPARGWSGGTSQDQSAIRR